MEVAEFLPCSQRINIVVMQSYYDDVKKVCENQSVWLPAEEC